jgi:hypothetical protein
LIWQEKEAEQKQKSMSDFYRETRENYKNKLADAFHKTILRQSAEGLGMSPAEKLVLIDRAESPEMQLAHFVAAKPEIDETPKAVKVFNRERREGFSIDPKQIEI